MTKLGNSPHVVNIDQFTRLLAQALDDLSAGVKVTREPKNVICFETPTRRVVYDTQRWVLQIFEAGGVRPIVTPDFFETLHEDLRVESKITFATVRAALNALPELVNELMGKVAHVTHPVSYVVTFEPAWVETLHVARPWQSS